MTTSELHAALVTAVDNVRSILGANGLGYFQLEISARGRTETDRSEVLIEYMLNGRVERYDDSARASGGDLMACVNEVIRRHEWAARNKPLSIADNSV